jgi:hypothetical protein
MKLEDMFGLLDKRRPGFELLYDKVRRTENPLIVETGCTRQPDNWFGDGQSTVVFNAMCELHDGTLNSVDISEDACRFAKKLVGNRVHVFCGDSVAWCHDAERMYGKVGRKIAVLYLDSYDLDVNNWHPSAQHHIYELLAIKGALEPGSLVAVDDNLIMENGKHVGKGTYIAEWMAKVGKKMVHQGYQWIWEW